MKILVTGATGLIGHHLVERLKREGHDVYGCSTGKSLNKPQVEATCNFTIVDLTDSQATVDYIKSVQPDVIYHLAANAAENKGQFSPIDMTARNLGMSMNVIVGAVRAGTKRIIYTSSIAVYGTLHTPFKESDDPKPQDIYGVNKFAVEKALRVLSNVHGFEYTIFRPHNVYGPGQDMSDPYRNVVTLFMNKLLHREKYTIYGDGSMTRGFSYVGDVVEVLVQSLYEKTHGLIFNIGADDQISLQRLSDEIQKVSGMNIPPNYLPDRPQEVAHAIADHTLLKTIFGYPDTSFEEGLRRTWAWASFVGPQEPVFTTPEIDSKKMPANWRKDTDVSSKN